MNKIFKNNYLLLIVLIIFTIFLTFFIRNIYILSNEKLSSFYLYANKIVYNEFDTYVVENGDIIIYISNKKDLKNEKFEQSFKNKINDLGLKNKLVYIENSEFTKEFKNKINNLYKTNIYYNNTPIILFIIDNKLVKTIYVDEVTDANTIYDYGEFE